MMDNRHRNSHEFRYKQIVHDVARKGLPRVERIQFAWERGNVRQA